jgi:hypothetical protein
MNASCGPKPRTLDPTSRSALCRGGFIVYFVTLIAASMMLCDCGTTPGIVMAAASLLPLIFGSRLQRIAAVLCLTIACVLTVIGYRSTITPRERAERVRQLQHEHPKP